MAVSVRIWAVSRGATPHQSSRPPTPVLIFGLPSSGKTTLATRVCERLTASGVASQLLDGDELRSALPPRLGFSDEDRHAQGLRAAFIAELLARHQVTPVMALVAPLRRTRAAIRTGLDGRLLTVQLVAPQSVRVARDTNGVYRASRARGDDGYGDIERPWEPPTTPPDLVLDTDRLSPSACEAEVVRLLLD